MLALFADIHSNLEALRACLEHARSRGATRHVFLGDLVGYGADPKAVLEVVRNHAAAGALVVQGNHDAAVAGSSAGLTEDARDTVLWTRELLSKEEIAWLGSLPLCIREEQTCFVHASAASPERWEYVEHPPAAKRSADAARSVWTFGGHVHRQLLFFGTAAGAMSAFVPVAGVRVPAPRTRRWVAVAGSVGQPRERNPAAAYALFDPVRETLAFERVPYDYLAAARKVRAAGLPDFSAWDAR